MGVEPTKAGSQFATRSVCLGDCPHFEASDAERAGHVGGGPSLEQEPVSKTADFSAGLRPPRDEFGDEKPKLLLLENVQYFRNHDKGRTFKRVQAEIQKAGYWFGDENAAILNTAEHTEIPQNRQRIFMIAANRSHFAKNSFRFPVAMPAGRLRDVRDFLDLSCKAPQGQYFQPSSQYYPLFAAALKKGERWALYQLRRTAGVI